MAIAFKKKRPKRKFKNKRPPKSTINMPSLTKEQRALLSLTQVPKDGYLTKAWESIQLVSNGGKPKAFESPEHLLKGAEEYFRWCIDNPWKKEEWKTGVNGIGLQSGGHVETTLGRPFTWDGLCLRLGVNDDFFHQFIYSLKKENPEYQNYTRVIVFIKQVIKQQKFEGASLGVFNANLIAYDLGMKKDVAGSGTVVNIQINITAEDSKEALDMIMERLGKIDEDADNVKQIE